MNRNFKPKYKFYTNDKKVVAVSTYARKNVRGVASCSDDDDFDISFGMKLAQIRCDKKINEKRLKHLNSKVSELNDIIDLLISDRDRLFSLINKTYDTISKLNDDEKSLLSE